MYRIWFSVTNISSILQPEIDYPVLEMPIKAVMLIQKLNVITREELIYLFISHLYGSVVLGLWETYVKILKSAAHRRLVATLNSFHNHLIFVSPGKW